VPLNLSRDIDKFNDSPIAGARRFTVTRVAVGTGPGTLTTGTETTGAVQDDFAPAQFFEMSDDAKLASPSFEPMQAGLRIGSSEFAFALAQGVASPLDYETRIVDRKAAVPPPPMKTRYLLSRRCSRCTRCTAPPAAVRSGVRSGERQVEPFAKVEPLRFAAVSDDLTPLPMRSATSPSRKRSAARRSRAAAWS
jgi:hypothetical protein